MQLVITTPNVIPVKTGTDTILDVRNMIDILYLSPPLSAGERQARLCN